MNVDITYNVENNVVNLIEKPKPIPKPRLEPCITFDIKETIKVVDGPLYITMKINRELSLGFLIDPMYGDYYYQITSLYLTISSKNL